jgi:phosphatidylserine decarboxylase
MASLDTPPPATPAVKWRFPDVHPEGRKYVVIAAVLAFIVWLLVPILTWPMIGLMVWVAAFFRDPVRVTPQGDGLIIAPADGLVTMIQRMPVPRELAGENGLGDKPLVRVSIFMSVFDVHINRTPIPGTIRQVVYISGKFLNADLDKASEENERQHVVVEGRDGTRVGFTQIAGLVARRIVGFVKPGDMVASGQRVGLTQIAGLVARRIMPFIKTGDIVAAGQRIGLIRFGSRVDVFLPDGIEPQVALGQRSVAGETVLGRPNVSAATGIAQ